MTTAFTYLQPLSRGDLALYLSDEAGPVAPTSVSYTLFFVRPDFSLLEVGASRRVPVSGAVGEYYVTGRAGELGQPGRWLVRWEYQLSPHAPAQVKDKCFYVQDAVQSPLDTTVRSVKYGWD
jgi:hypothetical protein